jgi:hypothetical protein
MSAQSAVDHAMIAVTWGATSSLEWVERGPDGDAPAGTDVGGPA